MEKPEDVEKIDYDNPPTEEKEGVVSSEEEEKEEADFEKYEQRKAAEKNADDRKAA